MKSNNIIRRDGKLRLLLLQAFIVGIAISITACGGKSGFDATDETGNVQAETGNKQESRDSVSGEDPEVKREGETIPELKSAAIGDSAQCFSEDLAWVEFVEGEDEKNRYGCIDKKGNVLFAFPWDRDDFYPTPFDNGYSFIADDSSIPVNGYISNECQSITVVDSKGNCKTFNASELGDTTNVEKEERGIVSCGGGYFVLYRHQEADFDKSDYPWTYEVYDANGNFVDYLSSTSSTFTAHYCGEGVFEFTRDYDGSDSILFFPTSDKFVQLTPSTDVYFFDGEDVAFLATGTDMEIRQAIGEEEWKESRITGAAFVTKDGEIIQRTIPDGLEPYGSNPRVSDGKFVLEGNDTYYSFDIKSESLSEMPSEYAKHQIISKNLVFHDDACVTLVQGADSKYYYCVYDNDWNRLFDPIDVSFMYAQSILFSNYTYYSDGVLPIVMNGDGDEQYSAIIDKEGETILSKNDGISGSIDGVFSRSVDGVTLYGLLSMDEGSGRSFYNAKAWKDVPIEYYDADGNKLFDSLTIDGMETLAF